MSDKEKEEIRKDLQECIKLLNMDGKNTKKQVKFLLEEILEEHFTKED